MSDSLIEKVAAEIDWEAFSPHISCGSRTKEFQDAARTKAKAAIATVLREIIADDSALFTVHYFVSAFARQNGIALIHIGEGKEGEKDGM